MDAKQPKLTNCGSKSSYSKLQLPNGAKSTFAPMPGDNTGPSTVNQTTSSSSPRVSKKLRPGPPPPPPPTKPPSLISPSSCDHDPLVVTSPPKRLGGKPSSNETLPSKYGGNNTTAGHSSTTSDDDAHVSLAQGGVTGNGGGDVISASTPPPFSYDNKTSAATTMTAAKINNNAFLQTSAACYSPKKCKKTSTNTNNKDEFLADNKNSSDGGDDVSVVCADTNNHHHQSFVADVGGGYPPSCSDSLIQTEVVVVCRPTTTAGSEKSQLGISSVSSPKQVIKYKKSRPAPPPPKPPDSSGDHTSKGGGLTTTEKRDIEGSGSCVVNKLGRSEINGLVAAVNRRESSSNQSDSEATTSTGTTSDLSRNNSSVSGSPRLSHKGRLMLGGGGKRSLIVKPSTPPPAPPGECRSSSSSSNSKQEVIMKKPEEHCGVIGRGDSPVSDNRGLCDLDMHGLNQTSANIDRNEKEEDKGNRTVDIIISKGELGTTGGINDQGVSSGNKPQDRQKPEQCDSNRVEIHSGDVVVDLVISAAEKEMHGGDKLKTVIPNDSADNNMDLSGKEDNSAGSTQALNTTPPPAAMVVTNNTCGSTKPHMRSPIHSQKPRRRKNHFALAMCCGLGGLARPESPLELELPMRTEGTLPRGNDVIVRGNEVSGNVRLVAGESSRSLTTTGGAVILPGGQCEPSKATTLPKGRQNIFDSLSSAGSPEGKNRHLKVSQAQSCHSLSVEKPVIQDVKLLKSTSKSPMPIRNRNYTVPCSETEDDVFLPESSHTPVSHTKQISSPTQNITLVTNPNSLEVEKVRLRTPSKSRTESDLSAKVIHKPRSQSVEDMSCIVVDLDLDVANEFERNKSYRSSFMSEDIRNSKPALFQKQGEFQTLLKHSKIDTDKVYALPQPACYGDSTLKAVKLITDKYDTLQRWKLRAMSFREDTLKNAARLKVQASASARKQKTETDRGKEGSISADSHQTINTGSDEIALVLQESEHQVVEKAGKNQETLEDVVDNSCSATLNQPQEAATTTTLPTSTSSSSFSSSSRLSKEHLHRIKVFFSSTDTEVVVCGCTSDMMLGTIDNSGQPKEWEHQATGVPVLVLNSGAGRAKRELHLVLADKDTGFSLWQDKINYLSQYKQQSSDLHTMHQSSSLMKLVGFQFHDSDASEEFFKRFREITQDANDELWKVSRGEKRKSQKKKMKHKAKVYTPVKGDISQPLQFEHVTNIDSRNPDLLRNINANLMQQRAAPDGGEKEQPDEVYRTRANSS